MSGYSVREEAPRSHFAMIPHLLDDLELTTKAYRLYGHLKRLAGEKGRANEGLDAMAAKCKLNKRTIMAAKTELVERELIEVKSSGDRMKPDEIILLDIWQRNSDHFGAVQSEERGAVSAPDGGAVSAPLAVQSGERKKNHREEPKEVVGREAGDEATNSLPDDTTSKCLLLLSRVKNFPRSQADNALYLAELRTEFPSVDAASVCRQYEIWHRDNPNKTKGFKSRLRNFFEKAQRDIDEGRRPAHNPATSSNGKKLHAEGEVWTENGKTFKKVGGEKIEVLN